MHTPRPWTVEGKAGYEAPVIRGNGRAIAKVLYDGGSEDREVDDNAALIATAPEMLAVCQDGLRNHRGKSPAQMLEQIAETFGEHSGYGIWLRLKAGQMRTAIAKMEGGAQ